MPPYDFLVDRSDLRRTEVADAPDPAEVALGPGQALLAVGRIALTANTITYGAIGDLIGYWKFFPAAREGWGRIPAWGFADVLRSEHPDLPAGGRVYGYLPMSTHVAVTPDAVGPGGFVDAAAHRAGLPEFYNRYVRVPADADGSLLAEGRAALFRPLFATAFLLDDWLAEHGFFGAERVVLSSASSKTALGLAFLLARDRAGEVAVTGLTSPRHVEFVRAAGAGAEAVAYGDLDSLDPAVPTVYVDFAGNAGLTERVHRHFGTALKASSQVGAADWEGLGAVPPDLPGPAPELFFAPARAAQRAADWGGAELQARVSRELATFLDSTAAWLRIVEGRGPVELEAVYRELLEGESDPAIGHVVAPER